MASSVDILIPDPTASTPSHGPGSLAQKESPNVRSFKPLADYWVGSTLHAREFYALGAIPPPVPRTGGDGYTPGTHLGASVGHPVADPVERVADVVAALGGGVKVVLKTTAARESEPFADTAVYYSAEVIVFAGDVERITCMAATDNEDAHEDFTPDSLAFAACAVWQSPEGALSKAMGKLLARGMGAQIMNALVRDPCTSIDPVLWTRAPEALSRQAAGPDGGADWPTMLAGYKGYMGEYRHFPESNDDVNSPWGMEAVAAAAWRTKAVIRLVTDPEHGVQAAARLQARFAQSDVLRGASAMGGGRYQVEAAQQLAGVLLAPDAKGRAERITFASEQADRIRADVKGLAERYLAELEAEEVIRRELREVGLEYRRAKTAWRASCREIDDAAAKRQYAGEMAVDAELEYPPEPIRPKEFLDPTELYEFPSLRIALRHLAKQHEYEVDAKDFVDTFVVPIVADDLGNSKSGWYDPFGEQPEDWPNQGHGWFTNGFVPLPFIDEEGYEYSKLKREWSFFAASSETRRDKRGAMHDLEVAMEQTVQGKKWRERAAKMGAKVAKPAFVAKHVADPAFVSRLGYDSSVQQERRASRQPAAPEFGKALHFPGYGQPAPPQFNASFGAPPLPLGPSFVDRSHEVEYDYGSDFSDEESLRGEPDNYGDTGLPAGGRYRATASAFGQGGSGTPVPQAGPSNQQYPRYDSPPMRPNPRRPPQGPQGPPPPYPASQYGRSDYAPSNYAQSEYPQSEYGGGGSEYGGGFQAEGSMPPPPLPKKRRNEGGHEFRGKGGRGGLKGGNSFGYPPRGQPPPSPRPLMHFPPHTPHGAPLPPQRTDTTVARDEATLDEIRAGELVPNNAPLAPGTRAPPFVRPTPNYVPLRAENLRMKREPEDREYWRRG
ncbi:hypothetical protein JCM10213_003323 [Rhodosporidiobolus nylandii]